MQGALAAQEELSRRLDALEKKCDVQFGTLFKIIRELMAPPEKPDQPPKKIGFLTKENAAGYFPRRKGSVQKRLSGDAAPER